MDNQFTTFVAFAGFAGFVIGVVLTWIVARMVALRPTDAVREHIGNSGIAALKRLAAQQTQHAHHLSEAHRLAQSAAAEMTKAAELLRQAEGGLRANQQELSALSSGAPSSSANQFDAEPLKPRAARA